MLNRCDSGVLGRASPPSQWVGNATKERARAGYTPQRRRFFSLLSSFLSLSRWRSKKTFFFYLIKGNKWRATRRPHASSSASGASVCCADSNWQLVPYFNSRSLSVADTYRAHGGNFTVRAASIPCSFHLVRLSLLNVEPFTRYHVANKWFMLIQAAKSKQRESDSGEKAPAMLMNSASVNVPCLVQWHHLRKPDGTHAILMGSLSFVYRDCDNCHLADSFLQPLTDRHNR